MRQIDFFENTAKEHAIAFASQGHETEIKLARDVAYKIANLKGSVTIDDVREYLPNMQWGNWTGAVFKDGRFTCIGFVQATHAGSRARIIRKWALKHKGI